MTLPALREELALYPGPNAADGSPTWSLHDPVRHLFFRIDWLSFEVLSRWSLGESEQITQQIAQETPLEVDQEAIQSMLAFLAENELLQRSQAEGSRWFLQQQAKRRTSLGSWLLHRYLFFRIPLLKPDAWLKRSQSWVAPFYTRSFVWLTLIALLLGVVEAIRQWQTFASTLVDTFTLQGLFAFFVTLVFVKFFHELGHAYTAKRFGCRVPTMGVAFLVMFPMAYTDVNDVWKLKNRRQRLAVGAAGVSTELIIAVWALLAWALLPDGYLRTGAFLLATTTWVSTLLINASPFLRFDGYFLLMDALDMPNLHQRAFALGKWRMRELLFKLGEEIPEPLTSRRQRGLILFAWITWLYRLIVFIGIAVMVYLLFPKPLGPFLAAVELSWFLGIPIWRELKEWQKRGKLLMRSPRTWQVLTLLGLLLWGLAWPWDPRIAAQAVLQPANHFTLYAPGAAKLLAVAVEQGQEVEQGALILQLENPDLVQKRELVLAQLANLEWQEARASVEATLLEKQQVLSAARVRSQSELESIDQELSRYRALAPFSGQVFFSQPDLGLGNWVADQEVLAILADPQSWHVETYLREAQLSRVKVGDRARFYSETPGQTQLTLRVAHIDRDATRVLNQGLLAAGRGGDIAVRPSGQGQWIPDQAVYRVLLVPDHEMNLNRVLWQRGRLVIMAAPESYLGAYFKSALAVVIREAGF